MIQRMWLLTLDDSFSDTRQWLFKNESDIVPSIRESYSALQVKFEHFPITSEVVVTSLNFGWKHKYSWSSIYVEEGVTHL